MSFPRIVRIGAIATAFAVAGWLLAQGQPPSKQYVVLLTRGPNWVAGKPSAEQALENHGRYLQEQMTKGALRLAGPFSTIQAAWSCTTGKTRRRCGRSPNTIPG